MDMALVELREQLDTAHAEFQAASHAIRVATESDDLDQLEAKFNDAEKAYLDAKHAHKQATDEQERALRRFQLEQRADDADKLDRAHVREQVKVGREPLTYRQHGPNSIFTDLVRAQFNQDRAAQDRLARHQREMAFERAVKTGEIPKDAQFDLSSTDSAGGYLVPPLWLQEEFVTLARAGRVAADVIGPRALPPQTDTINLPRMSTGTAVATQADLGTVQETDAAFDTIAGAVLTIAGLQDVAQQLVDRSIPGVDEVIFADLARAYAVTLDTAVINSATANNLGLLQATGLNAVTYTQATPTVANLYPKIADAIQQIHVGVFAPPTAILMHPRRWAFILAGLDSSNRPLISPVAPMNPVGSFGGVVSQGAVGTVQGIPVYTDANIPTTGGAGTNQDSIIVVRTEECYLYEDASGPYLETFRDVLSGNLAVRFRLHNYWAQINVRRPKAISAITGTGLVTPTF